MHVLSRDEARQRSHAIDLSTMKVTLDVRGGDSQDNTEFVVTSTFTLTSHADSTFVDIAGQVTRLSVNGEAREITQNDECLTLSSLPVDTECTVEVQARCPYSHSGEGLHRYIDPEDGRVYLYTQFEPQDAHRAWPCFDQPDLKAEWSFIVDAPKQWVVASNGAELHTEPIENGTRHVFARTRLLSSYITAVVAGDWAVIDGGTWSGGASDGQKIDVPLRLMCRSSLAQAIDSDDILSVTRAGLDFYHQHYGITYPWGKYDQIFVPEYNLGAMENPGCVTFNDSYLSRDTPTFAQRQRRANTILHEMCHMWFGDLVTPRWWDDLWLKESFAENQGALAASRATVYTGERAAFAAGRKIWAYEQDLMPTTHPIIADIPDVGSAKTNFDGITYAKGASVLNQLVATVGEEAFFEAARIYFQRHAFGSTSFQDLVDCLQEATGKDLSHWVSTWLTTSGPSKLVPHFDISRIGNVTNFQITDESESDTTRPHRFDVTTWAMKRDQLQMTHRFELTMEGRSQEVDPAGLLCRPAGITDMDLVVVNDGDLTYAVTYLDDRSASNALALISACPDLMTRCVVWGALFNAVRDCRLNPSDFTLAAFRHAENEVDETLADRLLELGRITLGTYVPKEQRGAIATTVGTLALRLSREHVTDRGRAWLKTLFFTYPMTDDPAISQTVESYANTLTSEIVWTGRTVIAASGSIGRDRIEAWLATSSTGEAKTASERAIAALPYEEEREASWSKLFVDGIANDTLSAILDGFAASSWQGSSFIDRGLGSLEYFWNTHSIALSIRYIKGLLSLPVYADSPESVEDHIDRVNRWLGEHENAAWPLRRLLIEHVDYASRAINVQRNWM